MGRFETEVLATDANVEALADMNGVWIDRVHDCHPPTEIILDMDSSVSPTHGDQEEQPTTVTSAAPATILYSCSTSFGDVERCSLRPGNVHSADDWEAC